MLTCPDYGLYPRIKALKAIIQGALGVQAVLNLLGDVYGVGFRVPPGDLEQP